MFALVTNAKEIIETSQSTADTTVAVQGNLGEQKQGTPTTPAACLESGYSHATSHSLRTKPNVSYQHVICLDVKLQDATGMQA